ncbi:MAG: hypothetical protein IT426_15145 [Pirellulales bacterium]|nr:hypothetical protein [Pirellulales bacterium]
MKRTIFVLLAVVTLAITTGCLRRQCRENACPDGSCPQAAAVVGDADCPRCRLLNGCCCLHRRCAGGQQVGDPGPASGAVAYPYYNLRGPRDFLERNPQSIGP